jgi:hypothetical protein
LNSTLLSNSTLPKVVVSIDDRTAVILVIAASFGLSIALFASFAPLLGCFPGLCPGGSLSHGLIFGAGSVITPVAPVLG